MTSAWAGNHGCGGGRARSRLLLRRLPALGFAVAGWQLGLSFFGPVAWGAELPSWYESVAADSLRARLLRPAEMGAEPPDVVRLFEDIEVDFRSTGQVRFLQRRASHVHTGSGVEETAVSLEESFESSILGMKGWHLDAGGRVEAVEERVRTQLGSELYSEGYLETLWARAAGPGSTVLFEFESTNRFADESTWIFELPADTPLGRWRCLVRHDAEVEVTAAWLYDPLSTPSAVSVDPVASSEAGTTTWVSESIPENAEGFAIRISDATRRRGTLRAWEDVAVWFRTLTLEALRDADGTARRSAELVAGVDDPEERTRRLLEFVQQSITYVQVYLDDGGWRPHHVEETLVDRIGDCKDMAHLGVALLAHAGIECSPALTNVGTEVWEDYPGRRFDHCIVAYRLPGPDSTWQFFDPTSRSTPLGWLPSALEGKRVLLAGVEPPVGLLRLPQSRPEENERSSTISIRLDASGAMQADVVERLTGHRAFALREHLRQSSPAEREKWLVRRLELGASDELSPALGIQGLDAPLDTLVLRYGLACPDWARVVGERLVVQPNVLSLRRARLVGVDEEEPEFAYPYVDRTAVMVAFPPGWNVESLPEAVVDESEVATYRRRFSVSGDTLRLEREEILAETRPRGEDLEIARRWDDAAYQADRRPVSIRRP